MSGQFLQPFHFPGACLTLYREFYPTLLIFTGVFPKIPVIGSGAMLKIKTSLSLYIEGDPLMFIQRT
jgi:hypothetical protein